jgi:hypothetical protein
VPIEATFNQPIFVTAPAGDARLFVVERPGTIRVVDANGSAAPTPFLDIASQVGTAGEEGLLGRAFSPTQASVGGGQVFRIR